MRRSLATKLALLLAALLAFLWYRQHKNVQFSQELRKARPALVSQVYGQVPRVVPYIDEKTHLWSDRSYHTAKRVEQLVGTHYARMARNADKPYLLRIDSLTTLFTLANRDELDAMEGWKEVNTPILVDDAYAPRRMDVLLKQEFAEGVIVIQPQLGGPAQPVFFDPAVVRLLADDDHK